MMQRRIWQVKKKENSLTVLIADSLGISETVAGVLVNRGINTPAEAKKFLHASVADLGDPLLLPDMEKGAKRICHALQNGERILIYGDYDVDGVTGTVLLTDFLRRLGGKIDYYIPDRREEGYGLNKQAIYEAFEAGAELVVSVDCGISSIAEAEYAAGLGLDLVITDHHQPPKELPKSAYALINPKLVGDTQVPWFELAGVGVALKVAQAVAALLPSDVVKNIWTDYFDLAALGTIADIVPLLGENRLFVKEGLTRLNQGQCRVGLRALIRSAGLKVGSISAGDLAFVLAPRLNACGRLAKADLAVELLLSEDPERNEAICRMLEQENRNRQELGDQIFQEAMTMLKKGLDKKVIVLASPNWHPGVIGIVASRLVEKFYRPTFLLTIEKGMAKGSGRSIRGFNLYQALENAREHLLKFGGHEMAAGLSLEQDALPLLQAELQKYAENVLDEKCLCPLLTLDAELTMSEITEGLVEELALLEPFGAGNPAPVFVLRNSRLIDAKVVGQEGQHLKFRVIDRQAGKRIDGIGFKLGELQEEVSGWESCDIAFIPELNTFQGVTRLQLKVKDLKDTKKPDDCFTPLSFLEQLYLDGEIWLEDDYYRDFPDKEEFFTKIVGVTFADRQKIIRQIRAGEMVTLQREADNPYDCHAIAVAYQGGVIGYLPARLAGHLASALDQEIEYETYVTQVTGEEKNFLGVNLCVRKVIDVYPKVDFRSVKEGLLRYSPVELGEKIRHAILGDAQYHEKQKEALRSLKSGQNTLVIFGTGRGKSAVFQAMTVYQALAENRMTILTFPLRSLVNDQEHRFKKIMTPLGIKVAAINGSVGIRGKKEFFKEYLQGKIDVVLTTPEFLVFHLKKFAVMSERIGFFVVDEAHHLADTQRKGYQLLGKCREYLGQPLTLAATATANDQTARTIVESLEIAQVITEKHVRANLHLVDKRTEKDKLPYLLKILDQKERMVIYVNSRRQAYRLATDLRYYYPAAKDEIGFYHGGLFSVQRNKLEKMFRSGDLRVMVTTSAFGEGIDIPDIQNVVLYHLCFSFTEFNQLAGRAGRNQEDAKIHLLYNKEDKKLNELILEGAAPTRAVLAKFYTYLREQGIKKKVLQFTNRELKEAMSRMGERNFQEHTASVCLGILEDLGLLLREVEGKERFIHLVPPPPGKLDLADSVRFLEGRDEYEEFQDFAAFALHESVEKILAAVNRPICPA